MPTLAKQDTISALKEMINQSQGIIVVEYRGLNAGKTQNFRKKIRAASGEVKIAKNTLMRIALRESELPTLDTIDTGPNAYVISYGDITAVAKTLRDFSKEKGNEFVVIKGGLLGDRVLSKEDVIALADLPPREELLAKMVGSMVAPIRGLLTVLNGPARAFVTCLSQIQEKKEKAA